MAGLADIIRAGIALAKTTTASLQVTVTHYAKTGTDGYGKPTYAAGVDLSVIVETTDTKRIDAHTTNAVVGPKLIVLQNVAITAEDKFELPDGTFVLAQDVKGFADPDDGSYYAEVQCGVPSRIGRQ